MITQLEILRFLDKTCPAWVTATVYKVGQYVQVSGVIYECIVEHTSGASFATDLTAVKWTTNTYALQCMNNAVSGVNKYCNRDFRQAAYTKYYNGYGHGKLFINNMPLSPAASSVTAIQYLDTDTGWIDLIDGSGDTIENSILKYPTHIQLLKGYTFPAGDKNIKVTAISGYASGTEWQTGKVYQVGNSVSNNSNNYTCLVAHTAGTFATDLAAADWILDTTEQLPGIIKQVTLEMAAWHFKTGDGAGAGLLGLTSKNLGGQSSQGTGIDSAGLQTKWQNLLTPFRVINV